PEGRGYEGLRSAQEYQRDPPGEPDARQFLGSHHLDGARRGAVCDHLSRFPRQHARQHDHLTAMRLKRVSRDALIVRRVRHGRGYAYQDADGKTWPAGELRERALHLGIPPAWTEVRVAPEPNMHIQACGLDAAGRVQYIYHPDWESRRVLKKQRQLALLTAALPKIRRRVAEDLEAEAGSRTLALAIGVAMIDRTAMRIGRERYLDARGTRGAGTLFTRDVSVHGDEITVKFPAKSGKVASYTLSDTKLAKAIERVKTIPGKRLLMYRDDEGKARSIRTEELNRYLREIAGAPVTAKDF